MYRKVRGLLFADRVIMDSSVYSCGIQVLEYATKSRVSYFKQYKSICIKILVILLLLFSRNAIACVVVSMEYSIIIGNCI